MILRKGKHLAVAVTILTLLSVSIAVLVFRRDLLEAWYLRKLESKDISERKSAVEKLGAMGSVRAIPLFAKMLTEQSEDLTKAIVTASKAIGPEAAPVVFQVTRSKEYDIAQFGAKTLTEMGPAIEIGEFTNNPTERMRYADALVENGRHEEALGQYLWCYDHGEENTIGFSGVRNSFLLSSIVQLGDLYPPALSALRVRRDRLEEKILNAASRTNWLKKLISGNQLLFDSHNYASLNRQLKDLPKTLSLFVTVKKLERGPEVRKGLLNEVIDLLLQEGRYTEIIDTTGDVKTWLEQRMLTSKIVSIGRPSGTAGGKYDPSTILQKSTIEEGGKFYQAYLGAEELDQATEIANLLINYSPSVETYKVLVHRAILAGKQDQVKNLLAHASKTLSEADFQLIKESENHPERLDTE